MLVGGGDTVKFNIREIRNDRRMSQEELAEKSGVSRATISGLETNPDVITTTETLQKIAKALDVKVSDFFAEEI